MTRETTERLKALLDAASEGLGATSGKKMFGCHALFARDQIFALVWKEGRLGVKLTDPAAFEKGMALKGAAPWSPGGKMKMAHWVLLPETIHARPGELKAWVAQAHQLALAAPAKKAKKVKKIKKG